MHELPTALLHLDSPGPERILPIGRSRVQGWLVPKPGSHYTDLRIVCGANILPAIHGLPRKDVAAYFQSPRPYLLAGFEISVDLPAGSHRLILEACVITGAWETLETLEVEAKSLCATDPLTAIVPLRVHEFGETLRVLLRRMGSVGLSSQAGATAVAHDTPFPHYLRHPHLPFRGHLDQPLAWSGSVYGRIPVSGWIYHETQAIKRMFVTADLQAVQNVPFGRATPFLSGRQAQFPQASHCGFDGYLDLPAQLPQPVTVRVYAELEDGSWHLGSVVRIAITDHEFAKQPLVRYSPLTFWRGWRALRQAITIRGIALETGPAYRQEIIKIWRDYATQAPRRIKSPTREKFTAQACPRPDKISEVHYFTHNLSLQGAPLFLLEHARHLYRETGARLIVTSGAEGPLRRAYESLGATVQVIDDSALLTAITSDQAERACANLAAAVDLRTANLLIANTLSAYWGVHLAHRAGRPVLYYVHESSPPRSFYRGVLPPAALALLEESFQLATHVSFLTSTSQRYFNSFSDQSNYGLLPGWIDLTGIDHFRANHSRDALRTQLGLSSEKKLVINVGTICDRKGQHLFARAVDLLWFNAPALAASAEFLMIGGEDTAFDRTLVNFLHELARPNLKIIPGTRDVYPYYGAADLFVCSSYEESFPRVILEAMAFGVPILSTHVHGIPEMVRADHEAVLVPPGDSAAMAAALQRLLASPETGRELAHHARIRVAAEFDAQVLLPRHLALARRLATSPRSQQEVIVI